MSKVNCRVLYLLYLHSQIVSVGETKYDEDGDAFSTVIATFIMKRSIGFYILETYMPFVCIVFVAATSSWISVQAVPARISIGVITVLSIVVHNSGIQRRMPPISYLKVITLLQIIFLITICMYLYTIANSYIT